ncbi:MAG: hypothetical protein WC551_11260 [Patescibacteria group bacterium]
MTKKRDMSDIIHTIIDEYRSGIKITELMPKYKVSGSKLRTEMVSVMGEKEYRRIARRNNKLAGAKRSTRFEVDINPAESASIVKAWCSGESIGSLVRRYHHCQQVIAKVIIEAVGQKQYTETAQWRKKNKRSRRTEVPSSLKGDTDKSHQDIAASGRQDVDGGLIVIYDCNGCGYSQPAAFDRCPKCGSYAIERIEHGANKVQTPTQANHYTETAA